MLRHRPGPDPHAISTVSSDEWLAGVLSLDARGLRELDRLMHDLAHGHPVGIMWQVGERELTEIYGSGENLEHHMAPIMAEVYSALAAQRKAVRHPETTARGIALTYLALRKRDRLSSKGRYGLLQPLLVHG